MSGAQGTIDVGEEAARKFVEEPFNCAEGIVAAFSEARGESTRAFTALATPFGGGVGSLGHMCGAISGGLMVLGRRGGELCLPRPTIRGMAQELYQDFEETFGTTSCRDLTRHDCQAAGGAPYDLRQCAKYLRFVADKTTELVARSEAPRS